MSDRTYQLEYVEAGSIQLVKRTCMNDPWTWTTTWGWTVGAGVGWDGGGQRGKNWDNCNRISKNEKEESSICIEGSSSQIKGQIRE